MNKKILLALIAFFIVTNLATAAYFLIKQNSKHGDKEVKIDILKDNEPIVENVATGTSIDNSSIDQIPLVIEPGGEELQINWLNKMEPIIINNSEYESKNPELGKFFRSGTIATGKYAGGDLVMAIISEMGDSVVRGVLLNGKFIILAGQSSGGWDFWAGEKAFGTDVSVDEKSLIKNLEPAQEIIIPNTSNKLIFIGQSLNALGADNKEAFRGQDGSLVYFSGGGLKGSTFEVKGADNTFFDYLLYLDFLPNGGLDNKSYVYQFNIPITTAKGDTVKQEYILRGGGCGSPEFADVKDSDLKVLGTANGAIFYELKDINFTLKDQETPFLQTLYDQYFPGYNTETQEYKEKVSYSNFLSGHPVIFWKDALGRFWEFKDSRYQQAVECGKPVIYLYPEKTTDVNVQVSPAGGFTKTEPAYGNGWNVKATPSGDIYNYGDNKSYPYLFWEGYALGYSQPQEGFVIESSNVEKFLREKLAKQGLVGREIDEFVEFWAPKMTETPYYFVTFVPQVEFDKLAPLNINPKPETVIRVFMDYTPLERPIRVTAQILKTPVRRGFTVVEWGGALHK